MIKFSDHRDYVRFELGKADSALCFELQKSVVSNTRHKDMSKFEFKFPVSSIKMPLNAKDCFIYVKFSP
jgi:hypothetical protein